MKIRILEPVFQGLQKKKRVCAYARVSSDSKRQEDSLENQTDTYERLITSNPEYEFAGVYADQGISGYCESRPQFQKMLGKAREGEIDLIITKSISRFARNTVTVLKVARELKELGVGIFFEEQNLNILSGDGEMMLAVLASFAQEESRSMSENNKWTIKKKFEQGEIMINTERFLGYDKDEYGGLIINQKEALVVDFLYDMTLFGLGNSRLKSLMNFLGVKSVTDVEWNESTVNGVLTNEKYKGDYHLQKYFTPENKRNQSRLNRGEVQSYYITDNHPAIVSEEKWNQVQAERERRKKERNIAVDNTEKYQNRYSLSGMLICPYCGKNLRRRMVYKGKIQWLCSTYIKEGKQACRGVRVDNIEVIKRNITEPTVVEEVSGHGKKHYRYTRKADFINGREYEPECAEVKGGGVLQGINRPRRTVIKL
ncbi:recombinase family protein [Lacrimispora xylanisolvens]|uniref:recombinase family protein n=1 Tax=Lacrimispora xylanisolvens TaxID=384636 RepID=UPI0024028C49